MKDNMATVVSFPKRTLNNSHFEALLRNATKDYVENEIRGKVTLPDLLDEHSGEAERVHDELLDAYRLQIQLENTGLPKGNQMSIPQSLTGYAAGEIVLGTGDIRVLRSDDGKNNSLIVKQYYYDTANGAIKWSGIWKEISQDDPSSPLMVLFSRMCPLAKQSEEHAYLKQLYKARKVTSFNDSQLVFCRNGVWDYRRKEFMSYDDPSFDSTYPDAVAMSKLPVYHPLGKGAVLYGQNIQCPIIHNDMDGTDWDPISQVDNLFDISTAEGAASVKIIWQSMQFLIRHINPAPHVYFLFINKDGRGHNGKSTLSGMMERLIVKVYEFGDDDLDCSGEKLISLSCDQFSDAAALYELGQSIKTAYAIIGHETSGSTAFISAKACRILKDLARCNRMTFRNIYEKSFSFRPSVYGCTHANNLPIFQEKTEAVVSHLVTIMFGQHFTDDRGYIIDDYIQREDVAEYLLYKLTVLDPCYEKYDSAALDILKPNSDEALANSMNTEKFFQYAIPRLRMNFMPTEMLYDMYQHWCEANGITGSSVVIKDVFVRDMQLYASDNDQSITWFKGNKRFSKKDFGYWQPLFAEIGNTKKYGLSPFVDKRAAKIDDRHIYIGHMEPSVFIIKDGNGKAQGRIFSQGGLLRTTKWQDLPPVDEPYDESDDEDEDEESPKG